MTGSKRETKEGGVPCWISIPLLMSGRPTGRLSPTKKGGTVGPPQRNLFPSFRNSSEGKSHIIGDKIAKQGLGSFIGLI